MYKFVLVILLSLTYGKSYCQSEVDERSDSYTIGKQMYKNGNYLGAYRYLLAYKFSYYDELTKPGNKVLFAGLNNAIVYCESQIKKGLSASQGYEGMGYSPSDVARAKQVITSKPTLSETHL